MKKTDTRLTPVELHMLLALGSEERHGYGIKLEVESRTGGRISPGSGTLYVAIQRLEDSGLIEASERVRRTKTGRERLRRRYFRLTARGKEQLRRQMVELDDLVRYARGLGLVESR